MFNDLPLPDLTLPIVRRKMTDHAKAEARAFQRELADRSIEALRLYKPQPWQDEYHKCPAKRRLVVGGNRGGKTLAGMIEDVRAITGQDPYDKYPAKDGTLMLVGFNWKHFKGTLVPKLLKPGAFLIIKDLTTGEWRAYDPRLPSDQERREEARPAPPLLAKRFIKKINWINRAKGEVDSIDLTTGWQVLCYSSEGQIPQGMDAHRYHIDEDVKLEGWAEEGQTRCASATGVNRAGKLIEGGVFDWTAMPHSENDALLNLIERANADVGQPNPRVVRFQPYFQDNYHVPQVERTAQMKDWADGGADVLRKRAFGEFTTDSVLMYPGFAVEHHCVDVRAFPQRHDWCRFMFVDPGHTICAVLFVAVPPPGIQKEHGYFVLFEDELYIEHCDAVKFAQAVKGKLDGKHYYSFIIDSHGGQLTDFGSGRSPREQYADELAKVGARSQVTGHQFESGSDVVDSRTQEFRLWLRVRESGRPILQVARQGDSQLLPHWEYEIKRYRKQKIRGKVIDKPVNRGLVHLMQLSEMAAAYHPEWHEPAQPKKPDSPIVQYYKAKQDKKHPRRGQVLLGSHS